MKQTRFVQHSLLFISAAVAGVTAVSTSHAHPDPYSVVMNLEITESRVSAEILVSLYLMDNLVELPRADSFYFNPEEQQAIVKLLEEYFLTEKTLVADGLEIHPVVKEIYLKAWDPLTFKSFIADTDELSINDADVYVQLSYPTIGASDRLEMVWNTHIEFAEIAVLVEDRAREQGGTQMLDEPGQKILWPPQSGDGPVAPTETSVRPTRTASLVNLPLLSITALLVGASGLWFFGRKRAKLGGRVAAGSLVAAAAFFPVTAAVPLGTQWSRLSPEEAEQVFTDLHRNVYRSFDYREEERIYDVLEQSLSGDLLTEVYREVHESFRMKNTEGEASTTIQGVEIMELKVPAARGPGKQSPLSFAVECRWRVSGLLYHWEHYHAQTNEYRANYTLEYQDEGWRITGLRILDRQRVSGLENASL